MLRVYLWLAKTETRRRLGMALRIAAAIVAVWTASTSYGMFKVRASVTKQHEELNRLRTKADALQAQVSLQRKAVRSHHGTLAQDSITDTTTVADVMNRIALGSGAHVESLRFTAGGKPGRRRTSSKPKAGAGDQSSDADMDMLRGNSFECQMSGQFGQLLRFLDMVADSPLAIELVDIDISRTNASPQSGVSILRMKIIGILQP